MFLLLFPVFHQAFVFSFKNYSYIQVSEKTAEQNGHPSLPTTATDTLPSSLEVSGTLVQGSDEVSLQEGRPEGPAQFSPDPNLSSDSYTLITPSPEEPPMSLLSTETLGGSEFAEAKEAQEGTLHLQNGDELHQEEKDSDQYATTADVGKQAGKNNCKTSVSSILQ